MSTNDQLQTQLDEVRAQLRRQKGGTLRRWLAPLVTSVLAFPLVALAVPPLSAPFEPGTTISSSEVNHNFEVLADAVGALEQTVTDLKTAGAGAVTIAEDAGQGPTLEPAAQEGPVEVRRVELSVPRSGTITAILSGSAYRPSSSSSGQCRLYAWLDLGSETPAPDLETSDTPMYAASDDANDYKNVGLSRSFSVAAGTRVVRALARTDASSSAQCRVWQSRLTVVFTPDAGL